MKPGDGARVLGFDPSRTGIRLTDCEVLEVGALAFDGPSPSEPASSRKADVLASHFFASHLGRAVTI
jgi:hypothetical protein